MITAMAPAFLLNSSGNTGLIAGETSSWQSPDYSVPDLPPLSGMPYADCYLRHPGSGHAVITPAYPGMSLTIGQPALIDVTKTSDKFPVFEVSNAKAGTTISGMLFDPYNNQIDVLSPVQVQNGTATLMFNDTLALAEGTYRAEFELKKDNLTYYDSYYFTAIDNYDRYRSIQNVRNSNNANLANTHTDRQTNVYPAIQLGDDGRLVYFPDYKGNKIMDYSRAGYGGGDTPIPYVPVAVTLHPHSDPRSDAYRMIQDAIDKVSSMPLVDGFRGVIYLEEGVYRVSRPLYVRASGVVIRGAGEGVPTGVIRTGSTITVQRANEDYEPGVTKLIATWAIRPGFAGLPAHSGGQNSPWSVDSSNTLINFIGSAVALGSSAYILDQYIGAGQRVVHVDDVSAFRAGDLVRIEKATHDNWARAMYMDMVDGGSNWISDPVDHVASEHEIASIDYDKNILILEDDLPDSIDMRWGVSRVVKIDADKRIYNVGIEQIQGIASFSSNNKPPLTRYGLTYQSYNDENHAGRFVSMNSVRDGWMSNFVSYHFDRVFMSLGQSRNITVQDGYGLDPVSQMNQGSRRYTFNISGSSSYILMQRLSARFARHAFIVASGTAGPNVFYDCYEEYPANTSEPHQRWSTGGLYDNVTGRIAIQNRWNSGESHGYSGVNYTIYNCIGAFIISQSQLSPNYLIGHRINEANDRLGTGIPVDGRVAFSRVSSDNMRIAGLNGGIVPNFPAYEYSVGSLVTPEVDNMPHSLYLQQLAERLNSQYGLEHNDELDIDAQSNESIEFYELSVPLYEGVTSVDDHQSASFNTRMVFIISGSIVFALGTGTASFFIIIARKKTPPD